MRDSSALDTGESVDLMPYEFHFARVISRLATELKLLVDVSRLGGQS